MRNYYAFGHAPWSGSTAPLKALEGKTATQVPGLPGISFDIVNRKMGAVSWKVGTPIFRLNLEGAVYSKIYLLVVPLLENHDTFSEVGKVSVEIVNSAGYGNQYGPGFINRDLYFPGDLDWFCPREIVGDFATASRPRPDVAPSFFLMRYIILLRQIPKVVILFFITVMVIDLTRLLLRKYRVKI